MIGAAANPVKVGLFRPEVMDRARSLLCMGRRRRRVRGADIVAVDLATEPGLAQSASVGEFEVVATERSSVRAGPLVMRRTPGAALPVDRSDRLAGTIAGAASPRWPDAPRIVAVGTDGWNGLSVPWLAFAAALTWC